MPIHDACADRQPEVLDVGVILLGCNAVHEILDRFARRQPASLAMPKRVREVPLEAQPDRDVFRIVAIAMAQNPQEAQPRLAVAGRMNVDHARHCMI